MDDLPIQNGDFHHRSHKYLGGSESHLVNVISPPRSYGILWVM